MMNRFVLILGIVTNCYLSFGQGFVFDPASLKGQNEFSIDRAPIPSSYSLEKYLPALYDQPASTCMAMSLALTRTMIWARSMNVTDKWIITENQMSPYFIYYYGRERNDLECSEGMQPVVALNVAKNIGFQKMLKIEFPFYYPFTNSPLCPSGIDFLPPDKQKHLDNARKFKISDWSYTTEIAGIKSAIAKGKPVIVGMTLPGSFAMCKSSSWQPYPSEKRETANLSHAMVAIGYDDLLNGGSIRIANSWGPEWGEKGKVWIKYSEFVRWLDVGFIVEVDNSSNTQALAIEKNNQYKLPKSQTFKASDYKGRSNFNNSEYIKIFSRKR